MAAFLDPSIYNFLSDADRQSAKKLISQQINHFEPDRGLPIQATTTPKVTTKSEVLGHLASLCGHTVDGSLAMTANGKQMTIDEEISTYVKSARSSNEFEKFWCNHHADMSRLARVVRRLNGIPATSVASESLFSTAGFLNRKQRSSLSSSALRHCIVLKDKHMLQKLKPKVWDVLRFCWKGNGTVFFSCASSCLYSSIENYCVFLTCSLFLLPTPSSCFWTSCRYSFTVHHAFQRNVLSGILRHMASVFYSWTVSLFTMLFTSSSLPMFIVFMFSCHSSLVAVTESTDKNLTVHERLWFNYYDKTYISWCVTISDSQQLEYSLGTDLLFSIRSWTWLDSRWKRNSANLRSKIFRRCAAATCFHRAPHEGLGRAAITIELSTRFRQYACISFTPWLSSSMRSKIPCWLFQLVYAYRAEHYRNCWKFLSSWSRKNLDDVQWGDTILLSILILTLVILLYLITSSQKLRRPFDFYRPVLNM